jgi:hypothetical protein
LKLDVSWPPMTSCSASEPPLYGTCR